MSKSDKILVIKGDITQQKTDAIVNAANTSLLGGGGVDGAIHRVAGKELLEECRTLNGCKTGEAKITKGYNLPSKFVIHTVGPVWNGGGRNEEQLLKNCYINSLKLAVENGIKTISIPSISTGVYRFPIEQAAEISVNAVRDFLSSNTSIEQVVFVCFNDENYKSIKEKLG